MNNTLVVLPLPWKSKRPPSFLGGLVTPSFNHFSLSKGLSSSKRFNGGNQPTPNMDGMGLKPGMNGHGFLGHII